MNKWYTFLLCLYMYSLPSIYSQQHIKNSTEDSFIISSTILNEDRRCLISLPSSYATKGEKEYPVIVLLDGNTFFKPTAGIVQFMSSDNNRNYQMPESIVVAIENVDRERDFTVTKLKTKRPNTMGGGQSFLAFIQKELLPYVDQEYRTQKIRTLIGHSLGGLLTLNAYMDANNVFDAYISIDPSIWWDNDTLQNKVNNISSTSFNKKLYIATANQGENNYERNKKRHDVFYALLIKQMPSKTNARIEYFEDEDHRSVPLKAMYNGLKYIFESPL